MTKSSVFLSILLIMSGPYPEKNFGGGFGNEAPKAPRTICRRRGDRDAERVEWVGNGEGVSHPQQTRGSGGAS